MSGLPKPRYQDHRRRLRLYSISSEILIEILRGKAVLGDNDLPEDAEIVAIRQDIDINPQGLTLAVQSSTFSVVPDDQVIPFAGPITIRLVSIPSAYEYLNKYPGLSVDPHKPAERDPVKSESSAWDLLH
jgi:hypothetical protein